MVCKVRRNFLQDVMLWNLFVPFAKINWFHSKQIITGKTMDGRPQQPRLGSAPYPFLCWAENEDIVLCSLPAMLLVLMAWWLAKQHPVFSTCAEWQSKNGNHLSRENFKLKWMRDCCAYASLLTQSLHLLLELTRGNTSKTPKMNELINKLFWYQMALNQAAITSSMIPRN